MTTEWKPHVGMFIKKIDGAQNSKYGIVVGSVHQITRVTKGVYCIDKPGTTTGWGIVKKYWEPAEPKVQIDKQYEELYT